MPTEQDELIMGKQPEFNSQVVYLRVEFRSLYFDARYALYIAS